MGETSSKTKGSVKKWFTGLKGEFNKIIWPTKKSVVKQTAIVTIITIILGILISLIDRIVQLGLDKIIG